MSRNINHSPKVDISEFHKKDTEAGKILITTVNISLKSLVNLSSNAGNADAVPVKMAMLYQNQRLRAAQVLPTKRSLVGSVFIGKIKNINVQSNACFVDIGNKITCFLPMQEADTPYVVNRSLDGSLKAGDELPIQITRDAQKNKLYSCTTHIQVANDYFVLTAANQAQINYSSKLSEPQTAGLKALVAEAKLLSSAQTAPQPLQIILRTQAGAFTDEKQLTKEWDSIYRDYLDIYTAAKTRTCYSCLKQPENSYIQLIGELAASWEYQEIVTDDKEIYDSFSSAGLNSASPQLPFDNGTENTSRPHTLRYYQDSLLSLNRLYGLDSKVEEALKPRIWLKSGANLVIEPTEALTVIDVNSAKKEASKGNQEIAAFSVNTEAANEIALQLRLRNLSGIIVADFINMRSKEQEKALLENLRKAVATDIIKTRVIDMTPLGLVEITRKKVQKSLYEQLKTHLLSDI